MAQQKDDPRNPKKPEQRQDMPQRQGESRPGEQREPGKPMQEPRHKG
ncbi:hypothetical protein [Microvirga flavescens]|nr:hypothetical protein [Microvirga flavescens]